MSTEKREEGQPAHNHPPGVAYYTHCPACVMQRDTMYDMKNDTLFSFRLPSDVLDRLDEIAQEEDRTIADIVRRAIREHIEALRPAGKQELRRTGIKRRGRA